MRLQRVLFLRLLSRRPCVTDAYSRSDDETFERRSHSFERCFHIVNDEQRGADDKSASVAGTDSPKAAAGARRLDARRLAPPSRIAPGLSSTLRLAPQRAAGTRPAASFAAGAACFAAGAASRKSTGSEFGQRHTTPKICARAPTIQTPTRDIRARRAHVENMR